MDYHAAELTERMRSDVQAREQWQALWDLPPADPAYRDAYAQVRDVSRANAVWFAGVLAESGWPRQSVVGEDAAEAAWVIAQHTDHDIGMQSECLRHMQGAVNDGEASAKRLAYLEDRVRLAQGRPQLYGTQEVRSPSGNWELRPVEDPEHLNDRRVAAGLPPLDL
jgi:uncharacterized protein DUF6624